MPKNIVVCCDGTGNQYGDHNTNVVNIFSALQRDPNQVIFYDPGVGTFSVHPALTAIARKFLRTLGLAFGLGITENILDAYHFIMQTYKDGDKIFIFGFSRGAYTARAVAAMLHKCGLLYPKNENLLPYAMQIFKRELRQEIIDGFKATFCRPCKVHFLGLWDTVSSVGWVWDPVTLPYTAHNPSVGIIRHAVSIDERRAFFRQNLWHPTKDKQDFKEVWFSGVHSDVGGYYCKSQSGLSKIALEWMTVEAMKSELRVNTNKVKEYLSSQGTPDPLGIIHKSLKSFWWIAEIWPKIYSFKNAKGEWKKGVRFNLARRRSIRENSCLYEAVIVRKKKIDYDPPNLPRKYQIEPMQGL
jgi:uncharacterized protein (DUF2235 family)